MGKQVTKSYQFAFLRFILSDDSQFNREVFPLPSMFYALQHKIRESALTLAGKHCVPRFRHMYEGSLEARHATGK